MEAKKTSRIAAVKWNEIEIGYLIRDPEGYLFKYDKEGMKTANGQGFTYLIGFKNTRQVYQSKKLFAVFTSRIPSKQRRGLDKRLGDLGLEEYDEFEILLATKGKTNTDSITIEEILDRERLRYARSRCITGKIDNTKKTKSIVRGEKVYEKW